jgi:hypothetical protein
MDDTPQSTENLPAAELDDVELLLSRTRLRLLIARTAPAERPRELTARYQELKNEVLKRQHAQWS